MARAEAEGDPAAVAICVATLHRPAGLRALLEGLAAQRTPPGYRWTVVVVDNDPAGGAEAVVTDGRKRLGLEIRYVVEPRPGVAHARNTAVRNAPGVDWVAFIDDDEYPARDWLATLLAVQAETGADVVSGPVVASPPSTSRTGLEDVAPRANAAIPKGARRKTAATGNVLVARALLGDSPFDAEHFRTSGEDTDCFVRLERQGAVIVWAPDAVANHVAEPGRQTVRWLARRAFRGGRDWSRVERRYHPGLVTRLRRLAAGVAHMGCGAGLLLTGVIVGRPTRAVRGVRRSALGAGQLAGLIGRRVPPRRIRIDVTTRA